MRKKLQSIIEITVFFVGNENGNSLLTFGRDSKKLFLRKTVQNGTLISESVKELLEEKKINGEYKGILSVINSVEDVKHLFNFLILCVVPQDPNLPFRPIREIIPKEGIFRVILEGWKDRSLIELPRLLPNEERAMKKKFYQLDLVIFAICVDSQDSILMVEERTGKWFLPAGHFEEGETIEAASKREMKEETGLDFQITSISEIVYGLSYYSPLHFVLVGNSEGKLKTEADHDSRSANWFPIIETQQGLQKREKKYRKPEEIGPMIDIFLENRKKNNFIPLFTLSNQILSKKE